MIVSDEENDHDATVEVPHCKVPCKCCQSKKKKHCTATTCPTQVKEEDRNWHHIQQCLAWKPMDVCEKTLKATTQYARNKLCLPLCDHYKSWHLMLDTFFASCKALGGYTCAQIYVGKTSILTEVFGIKSESQMGETLQDFIRKWGAPHFLLSDNTKSELSNTVLDILCKYNIKDIQTEPHHPNQNPMEHWIQEVKKTVNGILDKTGAPECLWHLCLQYVCYLLNCLAHTKLKACMLIKVAIGETPDISTLLQFSFYQPVFYYEKESFPTSKEHLGWWVGVAESQGDALTYCVLTIDNEIITRSVLRPADNPLHPNCCVRLAEPVSSPILESEDDDLDIDCLTLPMVDPNKLLGKSFIRDVHDSPHKFKVIEETDEGKYLCQVGDSHCEEILTYNEVMDHVHKKHLCDKYNNMFAFESILDHRKGKDRKFEVLVKWETEEEKWEPLKIMVKEDPITLAAYAAEHDLLN